MKIAVAGKGGAGKTTVAGILARSVAATGSDVLAIDVDDDPNLGIAIGVPPDEIPALPDHFVEQVDTPEGEIPYELQKEPPAIIADHGIEAPGGVTLVTAGPVEVSDGGFAMYHVTVRLLLPRIPDDEYDVTVVDMPNGFEHFGLGTATDVDVLVGVVEPSTPALETARRTIELAAELNIPDVRLVANKVRTDRDRNRIEAYCTEHGREIMAVIPDDTAIRHAELDGTAPVDGDPDSPAASGVADRAGKLTDTDTHCRHRPDH